MHAPLQAHHYVSHFTINTTYVLSQARVNVPDERFNWLCDLYKPKSEVPAFLDVVDIAGLVKYGGCVGVLR